MTNQILIDRLLYEEESATLDFKSEQYRFSNASDEEKSELLKDVISFANSWRRSDAYILVGVKDVKGGRSLIVDINEYLDDAHLQQFIKAKTNRPVDFSYQTVEFERLKIGLFKIPTQKRPLYLKKDYGRLKGNTVYIRRGSSTDVASLDEVASMGGENIFEEVREPLLEAFFVHGKYDEIQEVNVKIQTINYTFPDGSNIPDYGSSHQSVGTFQIARSLSLYVNHDFYRDHAKYISAFGKMKGFRVGVKNIGQKVAQDVRIIIEIECNNSELTICRKNKLPDLPSKDRDFIGISNLVGRAHTTSDIEVQKTALGWKITSLLGKVQPQEFKATVDRLFVGVEESRIINFDVKIFSDDLPAPKATSFEIDFDVLKKNVTVDQLLRIKI